MSRLRFLFLAVFLSLLFTVTTTTVVWAASQNRNEFTQEFPTKDAYPDQHAGYPCVRILMNRPSPISHREFMARLSEQFTFGHQNYTEVPQEVLRADAGRQVFISAFLQNKTIKGLIGLLATLLPADTKYMQTSSPSEWVSLGPIVKGENASIDYKGDEFRIAIEMPDQKKPFRAEFNIGPYNMPAQEIVSAAFIHNGESPHGITWWRHFQVLIKNPFVLDPSYYYQELNLYYNADRNLEVIAIRNKSDRPFAKWREQYMYIPKALVVPQNWDLLHGRG